MMALPAPDRRLTAAATTPSRSPLPAIRPATGQEMSALFLAVIEATEEAINSLFRATTITGNGRTVEALPFDAIPKNRSNLLLRKS
jgi:D-aminopeptidase